MGESDLQTSSDRPDTRVWLTHYLAPAVGMWSFAGVIMGGGAWQAGASTATSVGASIAQHALFCGVVALTMELAARPAMAWLEAWVAPRVPSPGLYALVGVTWGLVPLIPIGLWIALLGLPTTPGWLGLATGAFMLANAGVAVSHVMAAANRRRLVVEHRTHEAA